MKGAIAIGIVAVFIIYMIFVIIMKSKKSDEDVIEWPPHISKCPEYWNLNKSGQCVNNKKINVSDSSNINLNNVESYTMENKQNIIDNINGGNVPYHSWDGLTNAV